MIQVYRYYHLIPLIILTTRATTGADPEGVVGGGHTLVGGGAVIVGLFVKPILLEV